jgi:hypothetical protein
LSQSPLHKLQERLSVILAQLHDNLQHQISELTSPSSFVIHATPSVEMSAEVRPVDLHFCGQTGRSALYTLQEIHASVPVSRSAAVVSALPEHLGSEVFGGGVQSSAPFFLGVPCIATLLCDHLGTQYSFLSLAQVCVFLAQLIGEF